MAIDTKYGEVILEHGSIGEDEPVVVFRAQDILLTPVLYNYYLLCKHEGSPQRHLDLIVETRDRVLEWQAKHPTKIPASESSREWMD